MSTLSSAKRNSRQGFTLVELLVVIAIIAILLGLTFPALNGVIVRARTAKCSSNLHNIATAMIQYAGDNNGSLPISGSTVTYGNTDPGTGQYGWTQQLESYLGTGSAKEDPNGNSIYQCPDRGLVKGNTYYSYFNGAHAGYNYNAVPPASSFGAVNLMRMHSPSMHIIAGDISSAGLFGNDDDDKDDYTQDPGFQGWISATGTSPIAIHGGFVNIAFADGHVEAVRYFDNTKMTTVYDGPGTAYNYLYPH